MIKKTIKISRAACCFSLFIFLAAGAIGLSGCASRQKAYLPSIAPTPTGQHQIGKFVWFDLLTEDPQSVQQFYKELFGWRFAADKNSPDYIVIYSGDKPIGGIVPHEDKDPNLQESMWMVSLSVEDVNRAVSAVKARKGEVLDGPMDVKGRGRMAVVRDAEGAELVLIRAAGGDPPDVGVSSGEWLWVDLFTHDADQAKEFYGALGGYNPRTVEVEQGQTYTLLRRGNRAYAGIVKLRWKEVEPNWLPYIKVDDLEKTIKEAEKLGGTLLIRLSNLAIITDPSGAAFGIQKAGR
jgi:predicted enzyme related to lactoylglutathione lyase